MRHVSAARFRITTATIASSMLVALAVVALIGCDKNSDSPSSSQSAPATAAAVTIDQPASAAPAASGEEPMHADHGVTPGSYEDWCGEHAVPESLCTRCNPPLIAAFKATGDWCEEHGLPESQCLICNPELKIERPPRPEEARP